MLKWKQCLGALALGLSLTGAAWADASKVTPDVQGGPALDGRLTDLFGKGHKQAAANSGKRPMLLRSEAPVTRQKQPSRIVYAWSWIDAQPARKGDRQWRCLAEALYHEARGESVKGQFAVAEVILNRVESTLWPSTICNVVHQGTGRHLQCQFTYTCDGFSDRIRERKAFERAGKIAQVMMSGGARVLTGGATHYHTRAVNPRWSRKFPRTAEIGTHLFYRHPRS